jgi:hypothetical protein
MILSSLRRLIVCCLLCSPLYLWAGVENTSDSVMNAYVALALQGDLQSAGKRLAVMPDDDTAAVENLRKRFNERFVFRREIPKSSGNALVDDVAKAYRAYWTRELMGEHSENGNGRLLEAALRLALGAAGESSAANNDSSIHDAVADAVRARGFHLSQSPSPPMRDLLIWKNQRSGRFVIQLTDRKLSARVRFASNFFLSGWKSHAALERARTTGWIDNGILYCVDSAYTPNTEEFDISFLRHEGRHLADTAQFPGLDAAGLEYRAKLTELAFAHRTLNTLMTDFSTKAAPNPAAPHAYSNFQVMRDIRARLARSRQPVAAPNWWSEYGHGQINQAARALLEESTALLTARPL